MKLADLKMDPDFKNLLPELDAETYTALEKDIVANGILDPIITWNGYIADGHNRYEICKAHYINDVPTTPLKKNTKAEVMQWIVDHQFAKRNLKKSERVILLSKVEEQIAKEAKERQLSNLKQNAETSNLTERKADGETAEIMAKKLGVSKNTYKDMKTIVNKGTQNQINRMDKGGRGNGVSTIANEIRDGIPDGYRKCTKCGEVRKIEFFKKGEQKGTYRSFCKDCYNKAEQQRNYPQVMPDSLNPDIPIVVTDEVVVTEFKNIMESMEKSFRFSMETNKGHLNKDVIDSIAKAIDEHIETMNKLKGEIKNETEG